MRDTTDKIRLGLWAADEASVHGQSLVTRRVVTRVDDARWIKFTYPLGSVSALAGWVLVSLRLLVAVAFGQIDALYLVCSRSTLGFIRDVPGLLAAKLGLRVVVHAHGSDIVSLLRERPISSLARFLYRSVELIVPSQHLVGALGEVPLKKLHLCENFHISAAAAPRTPDKSSFLVLWNSNILASKGFFDVAEAVNRVCEERKDVVLVSVGVPIGDAESNRYATAARLSEVEKQAWFRYVGPVAPSAVTELCVNADAVVLPSRYASECQPLAIIEAMCLGKAVVVADTPALRATIGNYPATFVRPGSVEDLVTQLSVLVSEWSKDRRAFDLGRREFAETAARRFSVDRFDREMREFLRHPTPAACVRA